MTKGWHRSPALAIGAITALWLAGPASALADLRTDIATRAGEDGVVYVVDDHGVVLVDVGGEQSFRPASMLKVVTCLLAEHHLGVESRFRTEFHLDGSKLVVRGRGDPFLVSEELDRVATALAPLLDGRALDGVFVDDSYFSSDIVVPGVGASEQPYDALNSATAVNFNTVHVRVEGGEVRSAEKQTPLTPLAREVALRRGVRGTDRVSLSSRPEDVRRYVSELVAAKLRKQGVSVGHQWGPSSAPEAAPLYVHQSGKTVGDVCSAMLEFSNNYIANQVFLAVGAAVHGEPASLEKSRAVAEAFVAERPGLRGLRLVEGSGISYDNRATAISLVEALRLFQPHREWMKDRDGVRHKTGTLRVVRSVAGYLDTRGHGTVRFVIALDGGGSQRRWDILKLLGDGL